MGKVETWPGRGSFVLAAIGSAIGLGNVWRFPFIAYKYGGGAFILVYLVSLFIIGIPILILEFALGYHFKSSAPGALRRISPRWEWLGWFALLAGFGVVSYYVVVMGWAANYSVYSANLAWGENTESFFFNKVLNLSDSIFSIGSIRLNILLGLIVCWVWILLSIWKGPLTVGRVVYVTVTVPWLILIVFVIRGVTLPGAMEGLKYYLTPNFAQLRNPELWHAAFSQIFFTLTIGFGVMIAYAAFLPPKSDIVNNALLIALADALTAFIAGIAVFATLGYHSYMVGKPVSEVAKGGPSLAFVVYPMIINSLPGARLCGLLFFAMLLTLAVDSAFSLVEAISAGVTERFGWRRWKVNVGIMIVGILVGLIYTTSAGLYWLDVVDHFVTHLGLFSVALLQCIAAGYFYSLRTLRVSINEYSDIKLGKSWEYIIKYLVPPVSIFLLVCSLRKDIISPYGGYPRLATFLGGWLPIFLFVIISIVLARIAQKRDAGGFTP